MSKKHILQTIATLALSVGVLFAIAGCSFTQLEAGEAGAMAEESSEIYGTWESSTGFVEERLMQGSGMHSSGISSGMVTTPPPRLPHFRDTAEGEPVAIHQFVNKVIVDDEFAKITIQSKTADELGDAGFTLVVENRYNPLTSAGYGNYCYITPIMGTWTVNGVAMDPLTEGRIYPRHSGIVYLYFDELSTTDELVDIKGSFELYLISDWWNPVGVYEIQEP